MPFSVRGGSTLGTIVAVALYCSLRRYILQLESPCFALSHKVYMCVAQGRLPVYKIFSRERIKVNTGIQCLCSAYSVPGVHVQCLFMLLPCRCLRGV
jgi:hypothetical protein